MNRFSKTVYKYLDQAGWFEGRCAKEKRLIPNGYTLFPEAGKVLSEFGGLRIGECHQGKECATSDIEIDPSIGEGLEDIFKAYEIEFDIKLLPIGQFHRQQAYLVMDNLGRVYGYFDELDPLAVNFDQALEVLLQGLKFTEEKRPFEIHQ
jgi:hypothetical protein